MKYQITFGVWHWKAENRIYLDELFVIDFLSVDTMSHSFGVNFRSNVCCWADVLDSFCPIPCGTVSVWAVPLGGCPWPIWQRAWKGVCSSVQQVLDNGMWPTWQWTGKDLVACLHSVLWYWSIYVTAAGYFFFYSRGRHYFIFFNVFSVVFWFSGEFVIIQLRCLWSWFDQSKWSRICSVGSKCFSE